MARTCTVLLLAAACSGAPLPRQAPSRSFVFKMEAIVPADPSLRGPVTIWLPAPSEGPLQELGPLDIEARGGRVQEALDAYGNRILSLRGTPRPGAPLMLAYAVRVRRFEARRPEDLQESGAQPAYSPWLIPARRAPLERVRREALYATAGLTTTLAKARRLYEKVVAEVDYRKPPDGGWGRGDLAWVCENRYGNCSDFHTLFIAYCQAVGIPASFEIGFPLPDDQSPRERPLNGYHCWARFHVPGYGWVPVDASEARKHPEMHDFFFGGLTKDRIRLSRGRDLILAPKQAGPPLNFFVYPYAECDGRDVSAKVRRRITFRDLVPGRAGG